MDISDIIDEDFLGGIITPNIGEGQYADFSVFNQISYNCISKLEEKTNWFGSYLNIHSLTLGKSQTLQQKKKVI